MTRRINTEEFIQIEEWGYKRKNMKENLGIIDNKGKL